MCRFLVENGADVDEIATRVDDKEFQKYDSYYSHFFISIKAVRTLH